MEFEIAEHGRPEVARQLWTLWQASYREEARLLGAVDFPPLRRTDEQIQQADSVFYGIWYQDAWVALAEICDLGEEGVDISAFLVHPRWFRRGFGRQLLEYVVQACPGRPLTVSTATANLPALGLCEKMGFVRREEWRNAHGFDMVSLALT